MIDVVNSENRDTNNQLLEQMWQQRSDVFVDKLGWELPVRFLKSLEKTVKWEVNYLNR